MEEAEKLFLAALQEAKEGFGKRDPHVASASNNLVLCLSLNNLIIVVFRLYEKLRRLKCRADQSRTLKTKQVEFLSFGNIK